MAGQIVELADDTFQAEVMDAEGVVFVDFWAPWCGPCKQMMPTIEELASDYEGRARIAKLDTQDNPGAAAEHGIQSLPTVIVFKGGEVVERVVGYQAKEKLVSMLDGALGA